MRRKHDEAAKKYRDRTNPEPRRNFTHRAPSETVEAGKPALGGVIGPITPGEAQNERAEQDETDPSRDPIARRTIGSIRPTWVGGQRGEKPECRKPDPQVQADCKLPAGSELPAGIIHFNTCDFVGQP